jgi:nucleoside-triphosphatase THEP1
MSRIISARLSETWLKAAVVGSLWASFEIIIGSFLHNLRMPFAGTFLSFASVGLIIAFVQVWKNKGLIIFAGLIAALLKSMSPSAIILGPMIGIFSEALILEVFLLLLGRNLFGYMIAGALAVLSALIHKIVSLLVTYGFDLVVIIDQLYKYLIRQLGMEQGNPELIIGIVMLAYMLLGVAAALLGYIAGIKVRVQGQQEQHSIELQNEERFFSEGAEKYYSPWFLLLHVISIVGCLYMLNVLPFYVAVFPALLYSGVCLYLYRGGMRSFRKPSFWIWFMAITMLAAISWNAVSTGELWSTEGLLIGLKMNIRAIVILTGFAAISRELRSPIIRTVLYHHGFANLYHAVGLAFSVLPGIINSLPGVKRLFSEPIRSLSLIISNASSVYPLLEDELASQPPVIILTGQIQEGKTTFLLGLTAGLKDAGYRLGGFVARGIHEGEERIGYDLENIRTGESKVMIRKQAAAGWYRHGKYYFDPDGERFGRDILTEIDKNSTDLVIIDEVGPVEMKGKGWSGEIEKLVADKSVMQLWVVRKHLLKRVLRQWRVGDILIIDVARDAHDDALSDSISFIQAHNTSSIL